MGYSTYIGLIKPLLFGKEIVSTGMTKEVERCKKAIELAYKGKKVAVISSGDPGIYGMAGLVLELLKSYDRESRKDGVVEDLASLPSCVNSNPRSEIDIKIIPGVPSFCAGASLLGAPLMHDFASISLSDLLTPWDTILKRVESAAKGDFVIIFYNPRSKKRQDQLKEAVEVVSRYRDLDTPAGIVRDATREGERVILTTLKDLPNYYDEINMTTLIIIGNSTTFTHNGRMITPRGYRIDG